jgi:hypothetical protein
MKLCILSLLVTAACNTVDDRPETLAYITETVLAPNCGVAECHSSLRRQSNYVFDSVAEAQTSIKNGSLIVACTTPPCPNAPGGSYLLRVITDGDIYGNRMPLDEPLPNLDAVLIAKWITDGAPGYVP